jgi:hypothetical protein
LNQFRTRHPDEGAVCVMSNCTCQQCFPCSWGPKEENTLKK